MRYGTWSARACAAGAVLTAVAIGFRLGGGGRPSADPPKMDEQVLPGESELMARIDAKQRIAADVAAGRTSLLEAAAAFRDLDAHGPPSLVRMGFPQAASEDETYCRSVIGFAANTRAGIDDVVRRLEAELDERLRDGTLRLPGPDADHPAAPSRIASPDDCAWDFGRGGNRDDALSKDEYRPRPGPASPP